MNDGRNGVDANPTFHVVTQVDWVCWQNGSSFWSSKAESLGNTGNEDHDYFGSEKDDGDEAKEDSQHL